MTDRRPKLLFDALSAIDAARSFAAGKSIDDYEADLLLRSAVERQLEILGEACMRLAKDDPALFERLPETRLAVGLRNRIIHGYDAVDNLTVYRTVTDSLPALRLKLNDWLATI
jgi:uncharacterized protein with HEPN domain